MQQRIDNPQGEAASLKSGRIQAVRFPKERPGSASPIPFIVRYDSIYPMGIGANLATNPSIGRTPDPANDGIKAEPIRSRGITRSTDQVLTETVNAAKSKGLYVTIYLYQDSYHAFGELKESLSKAGVSYGLEFVEAGKGLWFSSEGTSPPEL